MTSRLTLICHGSTDALRKAAFPADEPLDAHGRADAAALAGQLPRTERCWTSPELRSRQTAEALQLDAVSLAALRDCDYGAWKGQTFDAVLTREPKAMEAWLRDPAASPHGGESLLSLMERVAQWLEAEKAVNGQAILVTHATIIRAAIVHAIHAAPDSFWRIDIAPLSITRLSGREGRWNLVSTGCSV
ncbi:MAG TPA: histidine phosphatase family protein [Pseudolabrys sp.]|nr:histidine phosphatase family protein [Pseudolabrys sp.]